MAQDELKQAIRSLQDEIKLAGGDEANPLAANVLKQICCERVKEPNNLILLTELAHRTAVGIRDPLNSENLDRYGEVAKQISERPLSSGQTLGMAATNFSGLLLLGGMAALICLGTGGVGGLVAGLCAVGAAVSGVFGVGFISCGIYTWKRPARYHTSAAAMSFLRNKRIIHQKEEFQPLDIDYTKKVFDPFRLQ